MERKITEKQADLLKRFAPKNYLDIDAASVKLEYSNIWPSRRKEKPWGPSMDSLINRGLLCIHKQTTETLMGDGTFYKDTYWRAATSWKGIKALQESESS
jgi:hypothetical protein